MEADVSTSNEEPKVDQVMSSFDGWESWGEGLTKIEGKRQFEFSPYRNDDIRRELIHRRKILRRRSPLYDQDILQKTNERRLSRAVSFNDTNTISTLLSQGVSPSCADSHKRTPLHLAACKGYSDVVRILLNNGANPNARDSMGNTPLHLAACTNNINVILLLLRAGTDASCIDKLGRTPLQLAESKLKILQQSNFPDEEIKTQVSQVIEMMLLFSSKNNPTLADLLERANLRVKESANRAQVDSQLKHLLDSLGSLSLKS